MSNLFTVGMYKLGDHYFTAAETCNFEQINPKTLEYLEKHDTNKCFGLGLVSAHPLTDPKTGTVYNVGASMMTGLKYHVLKISPSESSTSADNLLANSKSICSFQPSSFTKFGYAHSFGMSENYIVLVEQPFVTSLPKILGAVMSPGQCIKDWTEWRARKTSNRFFIIDKESGKLFDGFEIYSKNPFFFYHFINCFEDGDSLIVDLIAFPDDGVQEAVMLKNLRNPEQDEGTNLAEAQRFKIPIIQKGSKDIPEKMDLSKSSSTSATAIREGKRIILEPEILTKKGIEFPSLNKNFIGQKYKYFYGTGFVTKNGSYQNSVCKFDLELKTSSIWRENEHYYLSEPIFIANPSGVTEDDGILVVTVTDDRESARDFLLFLDGKTMKEVGRATFKASIPLSLHGVFTPENQE